MKNNTISQIYNTAGKSAAQLQHDNITQSKKMPTYIPEKCQFSSEKSIFSQNSTNNRKCLTMNPACIFSKKQNITRRYKMN